jgi:uncharacterized protein YjdB
MNTGIYKKISFWILVVLLSMGTQNVFAAVSVSSSSISYCKGASTDSVLIKSLVTATAGPIGWSTDPTAGTPSFTAPIPSSGTVGTTSYWVSEYDSISSTWSTPRVKIDVIIKALPSNPSVASPIDVCQGETAAALLAFGTDLKYYDDTLAYLGTTAPVPVTTTAGVQTFYVTQTDATTTCESDKEPITINVNASPAAPTVTSPVNLCEGIAASALSATGTSLLWYTVSSGGTGSATAPTPSTTTAGTTIYYVSQTNLSTGCEGSRASISAVVNPIPSAPGVSSISYCKNASASPLTATGTALKWYTAATGGTGSSTAPTPSTTTVGSTNYYVSQTVSTCESPRALITVTVNELPTISGTLTVCGTGSTSSLSATTLPSTSTTVWTSSNTAVATIDSTTGEVTPVAAGFSTITYTNVNGCTASVTFTVNAIPTPSIAAAETSGTTTNDGTICNGATVILTASGASTYSWSTGATTSAITLTPSSTTTYTVTATTSGCTATATRTITVNPIPVISGTLSACVGSTSGLSATTTAATPTAWTSSDTAVATVDPGTGVVTAVAAGTTTITYTNANGCTQTATFTVNALPTPSIAVTETSGTTANDSIICTGASATLTASGGTTYSWSTTETTTSISVSPTSTTVYTLTASSGTCSASTTRTITVNPLPTISGTLNACIGSSSTLTGSGTAATTAPWTSSNTSIATVASGVVTAIAAGTTTITYKDSNGCSVDASFTVNALPTISGTLSLCGIGTTRTLTGSATAHPSTAWSSSDTTVATISSTGVVTSVAAGSTTITYMNTNGCTTTATFNVYTAPTISGILSACVGLTSDLDATTTAASPTAWTSSDLSVATIDAATGIVTAVAAGTTTITYLNSDGCSVTATFTVNPLPTAPSVISPVTYCKGATATALTATGSSLLWYTVATGGSGSVAAPTPGTATPGTTTYYVSQTSGLGCEGPRASIDVVVNPIPAAPTVTPLTNLCKDVPASPLTATGSSLLWYTASTGGTGSSTAPTPNTAVVGLKSFYVSQTVLGCESPRATISVNVRVLPLAPTVVTPVAYCQLATATALTATAISSPSHSLKWYTVATGGTSSATAPTPLTTTAGTTNFYVTQTNSSTTCESPRALIEVVVNPTPTITGTLGICLSSTTTLTGSGTPDGSSPWTSSAPGVATISSSGVVTAVTAGTTTITYLDNKGCTTTASLIVSANPVISGTLSACVGLSSTLTATTSPDATSPWSSSALGVATISSSGVVTAVAAGTTTITYTNIYGCTTTATFTVNALPTPTIAVTETSGTTNDDATICTGASATMTASGGSTYLWSTGATTAAITVSPTATTSYTVTVTNATSCDSIINQTITVNPLPTPAIAVTETSGTTANDGTICIGASATMTASGGTTYLWSTGATTAAITESPTATTTYTVTVTNANNCSATETTQTITVNPLPTPAIAVTETSGTAANDAIICVGASATMTASGGSTYLWSTGATTAAITASPTTTTTYTVTVTNANNCSATATQTITVDPLPTPAIAVTETSGTTNNDAIICVGASATMTASGGTTYLWSTGATTAAITESPTATTTYTVTVTNANNCSATATQTITVNPLPTPAIAVTETSGTTANDGTICIGASATMTASGGTTYLWSTGATTAAITESPTATTTYTVTVTNANNCSATATQTITVNPLPTPAIAVTETSGTAANDAIICVGASATMTASGGSTYLWSTGATTAAITASPTTTTTYTVTVTNANNCSATATQTITVDPLPTPAIAVTETSGTTNNDAIICVGASATMTASGGTTYFWSTGATTAAITESPTATTTYTVTVTNANNCSATATQTITVNPLPTPAIAVTETSGTTANDGINLRIGAKCNDDSEWWNDLLVEYGCYNSSDYCKPNRQQLRIR